MNDKALREVLHQQSEQQMHLPSNFAYNTMRRIEREQLAQEKRERIYAIITIVTCCVLGIGTMAYFYGETIISSLSSMIQQNEGLGMLPGMTFCLLFFALLNSWLRKRFA